MKFLAPLILTLLTLAFAATQPQKSVIISFPSDTPAHYIESAKNAVLAAGGIITHEYKIIKGFACKGTASAFESVAALTEGSEYVPRIEEDQIISINGGGS